MIALLKTRPEGSFERPGALGALPQQIADIRKREWQTEGTVRVSLKEGRG